MHAAAPLVAATWIVLVRYASYTLEHLPTFPEGPQPPDPAVGIPVWGLARQFLTLAIAALALSALGARLLPERIGSVAAGPALLAIIGATMLLPRRYTLFVDDPVQRLWAPARTRWTIALAVPLVWLWHLCRDSGRPRVRARLRRMFDTPADEQPRAPLPEEAVPLLRGSPRR
jgi:hypothetical protein